MYTHTKIIHKYLKLHIIVLPTSCNNNNLAQSMSFFAVLVPAFRQSVKPVIKVGVLEPDHVTQYRSSYIIGV